MIFFTGVDNGNSDVKTPSTSIPSGYKTSTVLPSMTETYLFYNDTYYVPSKDRFDYLEDKTINERALIFTLFGIAEEMKRNAEKRGLDVQKTVSSYDKVVLGIGLPPLHMMANDKAKKNEAYLMQYMGEGIQFEYCGIKYDFKLQYCKTFPQDLAAIMISPKDEVVSSFSRYVAVDIGGGTMDAITFIDGKPDTSTCITEQVGVMMMYQDIALDVKRQFGVSIDSLNIEDCLSKKRTILSDEIVDYIYTLVQKWVDEKIVNKLSQNGINFASVPTLFLGGGAVLFKPYLKKNKVIKNYFFLRNGVNANAKGYAVLAKQLYQKEH